MLTRGALEPSHYLLSSEYTLKTVGEPVAVLSLCSLCETAIQILMEGQTTRKVRIQSKIDER